MYIVSLNSKYSYQPEDVGMLVLGNALIYWYCVKCISDEIS